MKVKEQKKDHYGRWIASIVFVLFLVTLYSFIIKTNNLILEGIGLGITLLLIFINLFYIIKSKLAIRKSSKMIRKEAVEEVTVSPLEAYFIHTLWYHKKNNIGEKQIVSELFYEMEKETIFFDGETLELNDKVDLEKLDAFEFHFLCGLFLSLTEFQQKEEMRIKKMKKYQKEKVSFPMAKIKEQALENLSNRNTEYEWIEQVREKYFLPLETPNSAFFTIISAFLILLNVMSAFTFIRQNGNLWNFYLPMIGAFLLALGITSSFRERVLLKEDQKEAVSQVLNYLKNLKTDFSSKDVLYLQAIGSVVDKKRMKIFQIE